MTYEPLHHKYRPQTFAALVGQQAIATTLVNALRQQRIAPAYLFTGARGTGKTSSARIFAKSLNCLKSEVPTEHPCGKCEVCRSIANGSALDVIEIDAASNTGVDNIRELIERAQFAPVQCRYKVYVLDEVHMLTGQAFNALLKTLEEPPPRVVFVLATTDPQRVLPTIISRCQRFDFRRIPLEAMVTHLRSIAQQEQIAVAADAMQLIAQISQGGLRDAESLLDQLSLLEGQVTTDRVWDLVGAVPEQDLLELVKAIGQDDAVTILERARRLMDRGREPLIVLQNLASFYRDLLIAKTAPDRRDLVSITPPTWAEVCQLVQGFDLSWILAGQRQLRASEFQVKNTTQPRLWLEVTLLGLLPSAIENQPGETHLAISAAVRPAVTPKPYSPPPAAALPPAALPTEAPAASAPVTPETERPEIEPARSVHKLEPFQQPEQLEQPLAPDNPSDETDRDQANLVQTWQQVLERVQPFSTRMMLRQQCHLISFTGQEARIGINSQPLFRLAKDKLPNIEAAFINLCDQPVRVTLEVLAARSQPALSEDTQVASPRSADPIAHSNPLPPVSPAETAMLPDVSADALLDPDIAAQSDSPDPATAPPWQGEDQGTKAVKSLAQFFNGQIVNLEDNGSTSQPTGAFNQSELVEPTAADEDEEEDEDELPF